MYLNSLGDKTKASTVTSWREGHRPLCFIFTIRVSLCPFVPTHSLWGEGAREYGVTHRLWRVESVWGHIVPPSVAATDSLASDLPPSPSDAWRLPPDVPETLKRMWLIILRIPSPPAEAHVSLSATGGGSCR